MQHVIRIRSIKARAERINLTLKAVCDGSGVEHSTVYRWLDEASNPGVVTFANAYERLEAWLDDQEHKLLTELAIQHAGRLPQGRAA